MAAEAVVTYFLEKLSTLITEEANQLQGVDAEVRLLQKELEWISLFVRDADEKRRSDSMVRLWVKQLREITFHAEDVIDEFILKVDKQTRNGFIGSLKNCITCTHQLPLLHSLGNQIKAINTMAEKISANQSKYGIQQVVRGESSFYSSNEASRLLLRQKANRAPISEEYDVVGIEDGMKQVKSLLLGGGGDDKQRRIVVSIVGMGGLGKTTLAKKIYNDSDVKRHFDCVSWVSISQEYTLTKLLEGIIKSVKTLSKEELERLQKLDEEQLKKMLRAYLQGDHKKYLIVLDDIWDIQSWSGLNNAFPDESNGSRILLTTRKKHVALHADPSPNNIHELRFLNEMESWELFLKKVFPLGGGGGIITTQDSKCPSKLQALGKEMVKKCCGLPLAVVVLGGLLSSKDKTEIIWSKVNASVKWQLTQGDGSYSCFEILALSYYDLPQYLKPCFMYMGLFPEDHEISASKLFQYWIAEGFVQRRGDETMEDIAEDYLEELIHRSMIQVGKWRYDGRVRSCHVHDLFRDLAIAEAKEDQFFEVYGRIDEFSANSNSNVRRLTIHGSDREEIRYFSDQFRHTRSLMGFGVSSEYDKQFLISIPGSFKLLKVLELGNCSIGYRLTKAIGELIHLKYLGLGKTSTISSSIIKLVNLQTLNIGLISGEFPHQIWRLRQLRHLKLGYNDDNEPPLLMLMCICCCTCCCIGCCIGMIDEILKKSMSTSTKGDSEINNLSNLETLQVRCHDGITAGFSKLRMLKKLDICVSHKNKEISDSIAKLTGLRSLKLSINGESGVEKFPEIQFSRHNYLTKLSLWGCLPYTENLFPPALIKLKLSESKIETEGMVQDLARLENLKFLVLFQNAYVGRKLVFPQGGFLQLQSLELYNLYELEELIVEEGALISLTHLKIERCYKMKMLPDGLQQLTTLEELRVKSMPKEFITRLSENDGEDWEKIKHIPSVIKE